MGFFNFFPIPKFLKISPYGFDISDESIKYLKFGEKNIEDYGEKKLEPGIIVSGEIVKEKEFTDFLKGAFRNSNINYAVASLPEEKAFIDIIELPKIENEDIENILMTQIENYFPLKLKEIVFDYKIIESGKSNEEIIDILVAAFPKNIVESYKNALVSAGISPLAFELEGEALKRALQEKNNPKFRMIMDFGKTRASFIIIKSDKVFFTSTVNIGGKDIDKAISRSLSLTLNEAESVKKEKGRIFPFMSGEKSKNSDYDLQTVLMPIISSIKQEVQKYLNYWQTHYKHRHNFKDSAEISEIILCGGDANFIGLSEYLAKNLNIPVNLANVWKNVFSFEEHIPEIEFNESLQYSTAIGLALKSRETGWE